MVEAGGSETALDTRALEKALRERVDGEVRFDAGSRGAYATDGSNYRQVPIGVVVPRTIEAGAAAVAVCSEYGAPVLSRGGGTSLGGQCTNTAVVIDWTKYCDKVLSIDADRRACVVEPGIVLDVLNRRLSDHHLQFGPKPSTHSHCSLGGMIGNNSCGGSAQAYGKTVDNVRRLEILTYDGTRCWVGPTSDDEYAEIIAAGGRRAEIHRGLRQIIDRTMADVRRGFPRIPRRVSGYNLDSLLPENGFDVARALVGSERTLVSVLRAELDLVPLPPYEALLVLGYDDICAAADDVPQLLKHSSPTQLEALDGRMAQLMREEGAHLDSLRELPEGESWLLVQFTGDSQDEVDEQGHELIRALGRGEDDPTVAFSDDPAREHKMLKAREAGLGVTARPPDGRETWEGWEDSAVAPEVLGDYLRDLKSLFADFGYDHPSLYGHFGQGCVHTRIPFELTTAEGVTNFREFLLRAADLVASYGGSLSGEHGDGQARGELLPRMFGEDVVAAFGQVKALFDPDNRMNPGKVVDPYRVDENLRLGPLWRPNSHDTHFSYPYDDHSFGRAVLRCVGIGNCRTHEGGVMCPSYRATGEEEHSTRGRARLLFEMLDGHADSAVTDGWRSTEVRDALDLCLACKGCKSDCPVGVDMATYKAEFLSHHYEGRLRPAAHYSMGWLPVWARLSRIAPRLVNAALGAPGIAGLGKRLAGVAEERDAPVFAEESFVQWWQARGNPDPDPADSRTVLLWPDTFSTYFHPNVAKSAVRVLEDAGFNVAVPTRAVCCGLTWISTGQLSTAERVLRRTLDVLRPLAGGRHTRRGSRTVLYGRLPRRRPRAAARGPGRATTGRAVPDVRRATPQPRTGRLAAPAAHQVGDRADPLPPARGHEGRRRPRIDAARRDRRPCPGRRLLRTRQQLRLRTRPLRPVHGRGRARGAARRTGDLPRRAGPRGRFQLPYADRTGRHRPARPAPGRGLGARHGRTPPARRPPREARRPARGLRPCWPRARSPLCSGQRRPSGPIGSATGNQRDERHPRSVDFNP